MALLPGPAKINQTNSIFWDQKWPKLAPWRWPKWPTQNSHRGYNKTIYP